MEISTLELEVVENAVVKATELTTLNELQLIVVAGGNAAVDFA